MSYTIITTAGNTLTTVFDGTVNTSSTSLALVGKNYAGYGVFLNENFVKLVENFANTSPPSAPLAGQIWYDSGSEKLRTYSGTQWKAIANIESASSAPVTPKIGDMWWDTTSAQLRMFSGSTWILVGPIAAYSASGQSGPTVETILDVNKQSHAIIKFTVSNIPVAIISKDDSFIPLTPIAGFAIIAPGVNLSNANTMTNPLFVGSASNALTLNGLSSTQFLRSDQNIITNYTVKVVNDTGLTVGASDNFNIGVAGGAVKLTSTVNNSDLNLWINKGGVDTRAIGINGVTGTVNIPGILTASSNVTVAGSLTVSNTTRLNGITTVASTLLPSANSTIEIGATNNRFKSVYADSFIGGSLASRDLALTGNLSVAGTTNLSGITTISSPLLPVANGTINLGSDSTRFATIYANKIVTPSLDIQNLILPGNLTVGGTTSLQSANVAGAFNAGGATTLSTLSVAAVSLRGNVIPTTTNTINLGASTNVYNSVYATSFIGTAMQAKYADLAERFAADMPMTAGTVVEIGGTHEITTAVHELSEAVFGVISSDPAYLMNATAGTDATHPPVAVSGRVPVRVIGTVKKGDRLVSAGNGVARSALRGECTAFNVIGRALADKTSIEEAMIDAIVKLN